jgi:hypothetical protein
MTSMTEQIFGKLFGDKGYISKALADLLWGNGIQSRCSINEQVDKQVFMS